MLNDSLQHYGVLGMKWGVRRYQNYDGTYTKKGLQRYNSSVDKAKAAKNEILEVKAARRSGSATKQDYKNAKNKLKKASKEVTSNYKKLKQDKLADQGKELYRSGKTIARNYNRFALQQYGVVAGSTAVIAILNEAGNARLANMSGGAIVIGGTAINAILYAKTQSENKKLRAYYAH